MSQPTGPTRISWNANTEPDLASYKLYVGRASGVYTVAGSPINVGNVTTYVYDVPQTQTGSWFFAITAVNAAGLESGFSNEISDTFQLILSARLTGPTTLTWNANTEPDLAGYKLYVGRSSGTYTIFGSPVDVGNVTRYVYSVPESGLWFFALTAYNSSGQESGFSNEVFALFDNPKYATAPARPIFRLNHR